MRTHWDTLLKFGKVSTNSTCATHVHISPKAKLGSEEKLKWTKEQLRGVARAVLYFDKAFDAILAPSRLGHYRTYSNKAKNKKLKDRNFEECCQLLQNAEIEDLLSLMQPSESEQDDGIPYVRWYRWNFEHTQDKGIGTIGTSFGSRL